MLSDEEKKEYEELKSLLYQGTLTQYGKRKLIGIIEKQSKEIEEYKKQLDLDYVDKHFVPIERYNQLEKEIEELKEKNEPQSDCTEPVERTEEMVNMRWVNHNYISKEEAKQKDKLIDEIILYIIRHNYFDTTEFDEKIVPTIENTRKYFEERCK